MDEMDDATRAKLERGLEALANAGMLNSFAIDTGKVIVAMDWTPKGVHYKNTLRQLMKALALESVEQELWNTVTFLAAWEED